MDNRIDTRCVVTGLGMISAIGNSVDECWSNALEGKGGIKKVRTVDTANCYADLGAEADCGDLNHVTENAGDMDRVVQLCLKASAEALKDAALDMDREDAHRVGVIMGSCVGGVLSIESYIKNGEKTEDIHKMSIASIANNVANYVGAKGVVTNVGNACAAGSISIAYACELIRAGVGDVFIAGGADAFASVPFSGFLALHALSGEPCSPFNHSNGITLGEGSGAVIVESYEHAAKRNARIYCDVLSAGISSDAYHITAPRPDGLGQMHAIRTAIDKSGIKESDVGYVNAHGTGTAKNDEAEFLSLHTIFDNTNADLTVSSTKAMVGHCLGAAGAIEAVFAIKSLTENKIPPTIGYSDEDIVRLAEKAGQIDFRPNHMRDKKLSYVMSNSFAFGGSNASIIFGADAGNVSETANDGKVYITGVGIVSPLGNGTDNYLEKAAQGAAPESVSMESKVGKEDYDRFGVKMAFYRKLDKFSLMQLVSGLEALKNAGVEITEENAAEMGMIIGTGDGPITTVYEFQENISENGNSAGSAFNFPNTVYNAAGGYLSIKTGMRGYNVTVAAGAQSGMSSIAYAYNEIKQNRASVMLASGTDENSRVMTKLYGQLGMIADEVTGAYKEKDGFVLGDGSTTLVLESEACANSRGARKYAELAGYAMAHEPVACGEIKGSEQGLKHAIQGAAAMAGIGLEQIDAVFGFGNGMRAVDDIEKKVYGELFKGNIPVHNVRDITGECRAASSALSVAHAAFTLSGDIPGRQKGYLVSEDSTEEKLADTSSYKYVLAVSYAFGGSYCALILKKC